MKLQFFFIVSTILGLVLFYFPVQEDRIAKLQLEKIWNQSGHHLREKALIHCSQVESQQDHLFASLFLNALKSNPLKEDLGSCPLEVQSAKINRFHLLTRFSVGVTLLDPKHQTLAQESFEFETPKPLSLLPIFIYSVAILTSVPFSLTATALLFILMACGLNLVSSVSLLWESLWFTLSTEKMIWGLMAILLWFGRQIVLCQVHPTSRTEHSPLEAWLNRMAGALIGLWNPLVFTLAGRYLVIRRSVASFLDGQVILAALSLYLLSFYLNEPLEALTAPRYFTFSVILFFMIKTWLGPTQKYNKLWELPNGKNALFTILIVEASTFFFSTPSQIPALNRVGIALLLSELIFFKKSHWKSTFKLCLPWLGILLVGFTLSSFSVLSGILDLVLVGMDPRLHPNYINFWTFFSGIFLGFISGNFSIVFFAYLTFMKTPKLPILNAALLDGLLLGCLLSPFSLYNLLPALQFGMNQRELLKLRWIELKDPIVVSLLIYAVAIFSSVSLLQPVTFVFSCAALLVLKLKQNNWLIRPKSFA